MNKEKILEIITEYPKHFTFKIRKIKEIHDQVMNDTSMFEDNCPYSERLYGVVYGDTRFCAKGERKKFVSFTKGYSFCGKANECRCCAESVAAKVSVAKATRSDNDIIMENRKRVSTNLKKYGVDNTGKIQKALDNHSDFYADELKVTTTVAQVKATKEERYGDPNYNNPLAIKATWADKKEYWMRRYDDKRLDILYDKEKLDEMYRTYSVAEIADMCNVHIQTVYRNLNKHGLREPFKSTQEQEIANFIQNDLGITNIVRGTRSIIGKELDIYLPDYKYAIEYNGVYWHHEDVAHIDKNYHYNKFKRCEEQEIRLLTIFSPAWNGKKNIVKNMIAHRLGGANVTTYARKCKVDRVATAEAKDLLTRTHIQGFTPCSFFYGLRNTEGTLVAVMGFSKPRTGIGKYRGKNTYELVRYASSGSVVGGASRLLKHFIRCHGPSKVISYSNNEWSDGNLYNVLGFKLEREWPPSYWYVHPKEEVMYHRYNFAKHKLVEQGYSEELSGTQIMKDRGFLKVWDCGKRTWVLDI